MAEVVQSKRRRDWDRLENFPCISAAVPICWHARLRGEQEDASHTNTVRCPAICSPLVLFLVVAFFLRVQLDNCLPGLILGLRLDWDISLLKGVSVQADA